MDGAGVSVSENEYKITKSNRIAQTKNNKTMEERKFRRTAEREKQVHAHWNKGFER